MSSNDIVVTLDGSSITVDPCMIDLGDARKVDMQFAVTRAPVGDVAAYRIEAQMLGKVPHLNASVRIGEVSAMYMPQSRGAHDIKFWVDEYSLFAYRSIAKILPAYVRKPCSILMVGGVHLVSGITAYQQRFKAMRELLHLFAHSYGLVVTDLRLHLGWDDSKQAERLHAMCNYWKEFGFEASPEDDAVYMHWNTAPWPMGSFMRTLDERMHSTASVERS